MIFHGTGKNNDATVITPFLVTMETFGQYEKLETKYRVILVSHARWPMRPVIELKWRTRQSEMLNVANYHRCRDSRGAGARARAERYLAKTIVGLG